MVPIILTSLKPMGVRALYCTVLYLSFIFIFICFNAVKKGGGGSQANCLGGIEDGLHHPYIFETNGSYNTPPPLQH